MNAPDNAREEDVRLLYSADPLPNGLRAVKASMKARGRLVNQHIKPGDAIQYKQFELEFPLNPHGRQDNPHGWHWVYFRCNLQLITPRAVRSEIMATPYATFYAQARFASYGRNSNKKNWTYLATIGINGVDVRDVLLGYADITCHPGEFAFQHVYLPPPPGYSSYPQDYWEAITDLTISGTGEQEAC